MQNSAESIFIVESNRISPRIRIYIQNRFSPWIRGPMGLAFNEKNWWSKISWYSPFNITKGGTYVHRIFFHLSVQYLFNLPGTGQNFEQIQKLKLVFHNLKHKKIHVGFIRESSEHFAPVASLFLQEEMYARFFGASYWTWDILQQLYVTV
jgi:hypothetical protein